ncbi:restriction endonuclease subunit S [Chloroflexota bacterium]
MPTLKPYPAYRDTALPWLPKIPKHWGVLRIKYSTYVKARVGWQGLTADEFISEGPILVTGTDFEDGKVNWQSCHHVSEERYLQDPYIMLQEDDLLITKDGTIGKIAIVRDIPVKATLNSGIFVTRSLKNLYSTKYLYWVLSSNIFFDFIDLLKSGTTINHLYQNTFVNFAFPSLPLEEQQVISIYLDRQTAKIDTLIAKKRRLLDMLAEQRAALISHAVTKGLNPAVKMKDSGVTWLGQVPRHWEKKKIKHVVHQIIDTEHKTAPFYPDGEYFVVRTSNIKSGKLIFDDAKYTNYEGYIEWTQRGKPNPGDILFTREAPAGEACIVPDNLKLCVGQRTVLFRINHKRIVSEYCLWSLYGGLAAEFINNLSQGSTVAHFNMQDIKNIPLYIPPLEEQKEIADYLNQQTERLSNLTTKIETAIERLKEYRAALISSVVTGKVQVK